MEPDNASKEGEELPLPPPCIPPDVVPMKEKKERVQMARPGFAKKGQQIPLLTNHFKVPVQNIDECFFHYSVNLKYEDNRPVYGKDIGRKGLKYSKYDIDSMLQACGVSLSTNFTQFEGRVLQAPKLIVGNGETFIPRNGRRNLSNKKFIAPAKLESWYVVNFSAQCDINDFQINW